MKIKLPKNLSNDEKNNENIEETVKKILNIKFLILFIFFFSLQIKLLHQVYFFN